MGCVVPFGKGATISCEARLAMNADKLTEFTVKPEQSAGLALPLLVLGLLVTGAALVHVRHQHRLAYVEVAGHAAERDRLNVEWGRLMIEESLWTSPGHVEFESRRRLDMREPEKTFFVKGG